MASAVCADAVAGNTGAEFLATPARSSTGGLQVSTHSQQQQRRTAVCATAVVPPGSMCEAPDACWPSTSTSEASPSPTCVERPNMQQEDPQAASQPLQQHQNTKGSGVASGEQQAMLQASCTASGRGGNASTSSSSKSDSGSGAGKGSSNRLRRDNTTHPTQSGGSGSNNTTADSRQQHSADPNACSSPRIALSVDVAAAAAAAATAAISPSPKQQQGASGRLSSPVPNGFMRASFSKQPQASAQTSRTFSPSPASTGNAAAEAQQTQLNDVPLAVGSPPCQHATGSPMQLRDSSNAANGRPLDLQEQRQRHDPVHRPQDGSSTHNRDDSSAADNRNPSTREPDRAATPDDGDSQRSSAEQRQGSGKVTTVGSRKQHARGGTGHPPGPATGQEQVNRSITPQASPKSRQRQQQHRQAADKQQGKQILTNVAGKPADASSPGPVLSPALLKQFGLPIGPLNGCTAVGEEQVRATIHSAAPMVLVAKDGSCFTPADDSCQLLTCNDEEGSSQVLEPVSSSPRKEPTKEQGKKDRGSPAGRGLHKQGNGQQDVHQQVPDAGADDCSTLPPAATMTPAAAATRSSSGPVVNAWQQHESAAVALQLTTSGSSQGQQHQGKGKGHSSTAAWLQQQQQPQQQTYGASVGLSSSSPQLSHMDRSDIMSDPGTVPGGGRAALGFDISESGYGRNKASGRNNRFMTHHVQHQQAGGHGGFVGQLPNMQHLSSPSTSGGRQGSSKDEGPGSGGPRKAGGGIGGRRGSKGSLDVYMPRSPQITAQGVSGGSGSATGGQRSIDVRFYQQQQGGAQGPPSGQISRSSSTNGRQTPLLSPNSVRRLQQQQGSSPLPPSSSTGSIPGQPSPLLLPESALLPLGSSQRPSSSSSSGMQAMPDLPPSAAGSLAPLGPCTDLERLLAAIGPTIQVNQSLTVQQAREFLTLKSVWDLFLEPSLWGLPVPTLGGPRGQSTAYYVPYMSAMQLFTRIEEPMSPATQPGASTTTAPTSSSSPSSTSGAAASSSSAASSCGSGSASPSIAGSSGSSCPSYAAAVAAGTAASIGGASPAAGGEAGPTAAASASPGAQQQQVLTALPAAAGPGGRGRLYSCNIKGWPRTMRLLLEHMEQELPFSRDPLYLQLEAMSGGQAAAEAVDAATAAAYGVASPALTGASSASPAAAVGGFTACGYPLVGPDLMATKLADVHPASWFAVAWYPVYRIPDAPLTARFLAFYSLRQLQDVLQGALSAAAGNPHARCQLGGLPMPVVGLKWYNTMSERWLDVLTASSKIGRNSSNGSSSAQQQAIDNSGDDGVQLVRMSQARVAEWHARLDDLQNTAARLAKGLGLKVLTPQGSKDVRLYHSDYEFFNSRS